MSTSKKGLAAALFSGAKGTLVEGDGTTALSDNTWYMVASKASTGTALPFAVGYLFKTPDSANAIVPIADDSVYPIDMSLMCRADATFSSESGTYEDTDDCSGGVVTTQLDGFITHSGSINAYLKFNADGTFGSDVQSNLMSQYFDVQTDDGEGTYGLTAKSNEPILLAILMDRDNTTSGNTQAWKLLWVNISSLTTDTPLSGPQALNSNWVVSQGPVTIYKRKTNSTEEVF